MDPFDKRIIIQNYMEICVQEMLPSILKGINSCTCEKCTLDVLAISLNSLKPKYVVTRRGELYSKLAMLRNQFDVDIIAAVTKAAVIVARSPRHNDLDDDLPPLYSKEARPRGNN